MKIYNEAWSDNWGFLPLTDEETHALAESRDAWCLASF